jgi:wobble nucleotide-excising tRNase
LQTVENDIQKYKLEKAVVQRLIDTIKSSKKDHIGKIEIDYEINEKEYLEILDKSVIAKTIERLKTNPNLNTWVNTGLKFHKDKKKCEFCGQDLPEGLIKSYEEHFSKDYEILLDELKQIMQRTKTKSIELFLPDKNRFYPQFADEFQNIKSKLEQDIKNYNNGIKNIIALLERKHSNPFNRLSSEFKTADTSNLKKALQSLNGIIQQHNDYDKNLSKEKNKAFEDLEKHYAYEFDHDNNYFKE